MPESYLLGIFLKNQGEYLSSDGRHLNKILLLLKRNSYLTSKIIICNH